MYYSLSSKSANRLRVNFQMKNATMPMTAMPPATARPTIEPVLRPGELSLSAADVPEAEVEAEDAEADCDCETTIVSVPCTGVDGVPVSVGGVVAVF